MPYGTICGTLNFTAPKEQLHYAARHNFTAACRNFTFDDIQGYAFARVEDMWRSVDDAGDVERADETVMDNDSLGSILARSPLRERPRSSQSVLAE